PEAREGDPRPATPTAENSVEELATEVAVVVFGYPEDPDLTEVEALLASQGVEYRAMNLHQQRRAADQIAAVTGVMQSPYVYIHGRFWGGLGEVQSLIGLGELAAVVDNELDKLSQEARRIGKIRDVFDDSLTRENIVARLQQGHILAIDGVDCWYEKGITAASARIYYDGRPRPGDALSEVADEIVARAQANPELVIKWLFEPEVDLDA
ncbi:MAG: glutaredoxin family protein, partial [Nannocystaceae bacterium]